MAMSIELDRVPERLRPLMTELCDVAVWLSEKISLGALDGALGASAGTNSDGDEQKALDVLADEAFADAFKRSSVRHYASEEREEVETFDPEGKFAVAIDPLDGSSNIDTNVSIGTIFSIFGIAIVFLIPNSDCSFPATSF